jgi:hypothetical protein
MFSGLPLANLITQFFRYQQQQQLFNFSISKWLPRVFINYLENFLT